MHFRLNQSADLAISQGQNMIIACLLLFAKLFVSPSHVTSNSAGVSTTKTDLPADDFNSEMSLKERRLKLNREIVALAMNQLGLKGSKRQLCFLDYHITNWPTLVPHRFINWDEQALIDLSHNLPSMVFTKKASGKYVDERKEIRRLLLVMLLKCFNEQSQDMKASKIPWSKYHVKGWPLGVSFRPGNWNCSEVLKIFRHLDGIRFEKVFPRDEGTVTCIDGVDVNAKSIGNKRKRKDEQISQDPEIETAMPKLPKAKRRVRSSSTSDFDSFDNEYYPCFVESSLNSSKELVDEFIADKLKGYDPENDEF